MGNATDPGERLQRAPHDAAPDSATGRVIVVGSLNVDFVVRVARLPAPGETVGGGRFERHDGGKGGNQAVAAARLGARVEFIGAVGADALGEAAVAALRGEGVGTGGVVVMPDVATGVAEILVDERGENMIALAPGANGALTVAAVTEALAALRLSAADIVLVSHEIPTDVVRTTLSLARAAGACSILNPAPATGLDRGLLGLADLLTPNRSELASLARADGSAPAVSPSGGAVESQVCRLIAGHGTSRGPRDGVVVTLGSAGVLLVARADEATRSLAIPAWQVTAVDTTGAGDAFNGALAVGLAAGLSLEAATRRAMIAAGLATTKSGAREGMPNVDQLEQALGGQGRG